MCLFNALIIIIISLARLVCVVYAPKMFLSLSFQTCNPCWHVWLCSVCVHQWWCGWLSVIIFRDNTRETTTFPHIFMRMVLCALHKINFYHLPYIFAIKCMKKSSYNVIYYLCIYNPNVPHTHTGITWNNIQNASSRRNYFSFNI